ncbi:MAG: phage tail protein [Paracoccus sp. (in: a-proteobacteria)]|uniref:phage tail protein n=1 Tax=Paracoccus sp. TaxID=267 RepID=UPI00391A0B2A
MPEPQSMNASAEQQPVRNFNFHVEIAGMVAGQFTAVSGLGARVHPIRYREAGAGQIVRSLPGPVEYAEATLRYGLSQGTELWAWMQTSVSGRVDRRNISIIMFGTDGTSEVLRWNLFNAWPSEWQGACLDTLGREVAIETLKLAFDRLERG